MLKMLEILAITTLTVLTIIAITLLFNYLYPPIHGSHGNARLHLDLETGCEYIDNDQGCPTPRLDAGRHMGCK